MNREEAWLLEEKYNGEKSEGFFADCERLRSGEPLAYIIGFVPFLHTTIYLDSRPLIPRSETEFWVEKAIAHIRSVAPKTPHILDLCAGTGAIGVAVLRAIPGTQVTFGEVDKTHLPTIEKNVEENRITYDTISAPRSTVVQSDLFENIKGKFDYILTNPPYIDREANTVDKHVEAFEPHLALFGGEDGLELIEKILKNASRYLLPKGELWLEHEPAQVESIKTRAAHYGLRATVHNDQYGVPRYSTFTVAQ